MILSGIISLLGGGVAKELASAYRAHEESKTDQERIASQERIDRLQQMRAVQEAEAKWFLSVAFRVFLSMPAGLWDWKIIVVDKMFCPAWWGVACRTDTLGPEMWAYIGAVHAYWLWAVTIGKNK